MKLHSRALIALAAATAAAIALCGQPTWGYTLKHTKATGEVIDVVYDYNIKLSGTVSELKEKVAQEYQAPSEGVHVLCNGEEKQDQFDLGQLQGRAHNDLHVILDFFLVRVAKPDGSYAILAGKKEETVASFKDKLAIRLNVPPEMQRLIDATRELQDGEQLAESLILDRTSYFVSVQWKPARVRVKFPNGEIITFEYEHTEKVDNLKDKIQQAKGIARERQSLLLTSEGELNDDNKLLISLRLTKNSTLTLVERGPGEPEIIYVRLASRRLLTFEVSLASDTVASLKEKISQSEGLAREQQHLFVFKGKEMANGRLLGDYVTKSESVVDLSLCSLVESSSGQGAVVKHHVHFGQVGEEIKLKEPLRISADDTVASVKEAVRSSQNIPPEYTMHVFFENNELDDNRSLLEHVTNNGSMLHMTRRRKDGPAMIHVRLPTGRLITFEMETSNTVGQLREFVQRELEAFKTSGKRLFFGSKVLKDDKTLNDYNIMDGSTINLILVAP